MPPLGGAAEHGGSPTSETQYSIAVIASTFPPAFKGGGPARTLEALVADSPPGFRVLVLAPDQDLGDSERLPVASNRWSHHGARAVYYFSAGRLSEVFRAFRAIRRERPNAVYVNSFFSPLFAIVPIVLCRVGFLRTEQLLIAPRGEFDGGALALKGIKKKIYLQAFKATGVQRRVVWHASSPLEKTAIVGVFGPDARILVRENETNLPLVPVLPMQAQGALNLVFLSRITRKKGLDTVLRALKCVTVDVKLDVFGPGEDRKYVSECLKIVAELPSNVLVTFKGPLERPRILATLSGYNAMVFPTLGENFGHVIAEALSASCPVICSDRTPWTEVLRTGGGVVVDSPTDAAWAHAIESIAALSQAERQSVRLRAGEAFTQWRQAEKGRHVFEMLADMGEQNTAEALTRVEPMNTTETR